MTEEEDVTRITEYFKKYDLEEFLVRMLMELGKQAPQDPLEFMHQYFFKFHTKTLYFCLQISPKLLISNDFFKMIVVE